MYSLFNKSFKGSKTSQDSCSSELDPRQCGETRSLIKRACTEETREEQVGRVFLTPWLLYIKKILRDLD
jgi:hypothetical protein